MFWVVEITNQSRERGEIELIETKDFSSYEDASAYFEYKEKHLSRLRANGEAFGMYVRPPFQVSDQWIEKVKLELEN